MMQSVSVVLAAAVLFAGCVRPGAEIPSPTLAPGVTVRFGEHTVTAEVATTREARYTGLRNRSSLAPDAGMIFLFAYPETGGFYMEDTTIPLSIAYMRRVGPARYEVLAVLDMEPLDANSAHYDPGVAYDAALEVNLGWFEEAAVRKGSLAVVEGHLANLL